MPAADAGLADAEPMADARAGDAPSSGPCDPVEQTGCQAAQKCSIIPGEAPGGARIGCVDASSATRGLYEACTPATVDSPDDCVRGLACRGEVSPRCAEFCASDPFDTCSSQQVCAFDVDLDGDLAVDVQFCAETCDLLAQDCASAVDACYPSRQGTVCAIEGAGDTPVGEGGICPYANSCAEGLGCFLVGNNPDWICFKICDPQGIGPGCSASQVCNPVQDEDWGLCIASF